MKILHFLTSINTGGAEKFCVDLCNVQANNLDDTIYLCVLDALNDTQPLVKNISSNVQIISLNKKGGYSFKIIKRVYDLLKKIRPDFIHLNGRSIMYTSVPILLTRIPSIYTVHTLANKEYNKFLTQYNKFLFKKIPKLFTPVAISETVLKSIQTTYGQEFSELIYNGSSQLYTTKSLGTVEKYIESEKLNEKTVVFLYVGRIAPEKNTLLLVNSFNKLLDDEYNVILLIIGYDPTINKNYLPQCIKENKYPDKIKFLGRKENIADYLSCTDALCLTSTYEGLGIVALESFSMGVPVLSTPSGGPSELITHGVNGYVSTEINVDSYKELVKQFITQPIYRKDEIIKIYQEKYTMKSCAKKYLQLYKNIIGEK